MKGIRTWAICSFVIAASLATFAQAQQTRGPTKLREEASRLRQQGNWKDALEKLEVLLTDPAVAAADTPGDLRAAVECLRRLSLNGEVDRLLEKTLQVHGNDWRVLSEAARQLSNSPHDGLIIDRKFQRSPVAGNSSGQWIQTLEQDRQQSLAWLVKALTLVGELPPETLVVAATDSDAKPVDAAQPATPQPATPQPATPQPAATDNATASDRAELWLRLIKTLLISRESRWSWRLLTKTPLDQVPDYLDFEAPTYYPERYASVDEAGKPIFWQMPESWLAANSDAQRLRWALKQIEASDEPSKQSEAKMAWANLLHSQFSVDTLQEQLRLFWSRGPSGAQRGDNTAPDAVDGESDDKSQLKDEASGILAVHTLGENETIAKLASGVRRFDLPDEFNPIRIYQQLSQGNDATAQTAQAQLVSTFLNRRQYDKAAEMLKQSIERFGDVRGDKQRELDNIVNPRGAFDPVEAQPAGQGAKLKLLFRNARSVAFTARRVDLEKILADTKGFYRTFDSSRLPAFGGKENTWPPQIDDPSQLFSEAQLSKYVGPPVASWTSDLEPREHHWDRRITIATPLDKAGLYVVNASLDDGQHTARCLVWINDLAIVRKNVDRGQLFYVADAITGAPVAGANVEFFGFEGSGRDRQRGFVIQNFARKTDAQGQIVLADPQAASKQWLVVARDAQGRLSVSGMQHFWYTDIQRQSYSQLKAYGVADQPVHRPGDRLRAKFWLGQASYSPDAATTPLKENRCTVSLTDPHGKVFWSEARTTDEFGGVEVDIQLPQTASLGIYTFSVVADNRALEGNLQVRVEEFRKPEFEVKIEAPSDPVRLGEKIEAVIKAKYYFGSPVTDAYVNVKVTRTAYVDDWFPIRPFDWCYGPGYWWFAYDYEWYPGWRRWAGCSMPVREWMPRFGFEPPELVLEQELQLDADGTAKISIDTAMAADVFGNQDHKYDIQVEVRDASRRTLSAKGSVIASREAFKIYSWLGRGYYDVNQTVDAHFTAQTLDRRPIEASGKLDLLRITYDAQRQPHETVVESWEAKTDQQGNFTQRFVARRGGQYRLRLRLKDKADHEVEGAYVFTVRGDNQAADNFRFSELELIPDKAEYAPGDRVQLQINADRADATVLLFVRAASGVVPQPKIIRLSGKTAKIEIPVLADDQPNFFVEALTIFNGKFYSAVREIIVPPASRVLDVALQPNKEEYLPGEKAGIDVTVKDANGKPVVGSVLVAVYDRALEQIAPDALPGDIREFFWKWRRSHHPMTTENLSRVTSPVHIDDVPMLNPLGIFGQSLGDDIKLLTGGAGGLRQMRSAVREGGGMMGAGGGMMPNGARAMSMDAAMPAPFAKAMALQGGPGTVGTVAPTAVRKEFADSALWLTNLQCDANGHAHAEFTMPENLTDWQMRSWAIGSGLQVGSGAATAVTHKHILVRLSTPRFLVERDQVVLSAIVHNDFDVAHDVRVRLEIDGQTQLALVDGVQAQRTVHIAAHEQARVDWPCRALAEGEVTLRAFAESANESDAMQLKLPIIVNGILKTDSWAKTVRSDQASQSIQLKIPTERRAEHSRLTVRLSPSLALAMVDALPYLAEYPYECTEQSLNRFLPTVITQRLLGELKIDLEQVKQRRNNLNAQEIGDPQARAAGWKRFDRNPVFDKGEVDRMVDAGVQKLTDMQLGDGGWGWFSGVHERSGAHTTATVVRGLLLAQQNGAAIVPDVLERGLAWLEQYQNAELQKLNNAAAKTQPYKEQPDNSDALVFHTLVLAGRQNAAMQSELFEKRAGLSVYGKSLLAWATHKLNNQEQTAMLRRNIEQFLVEDAENETAYLRDQSPWWLWYGSEIEATAMYLKLLSAQEPKGRVAPRLVKYLLNNRKHATYWSSTRDTALVVEAFGDYLRSSGETQSSVAGEVWLSGKRLGSVDFTPANLFTAQTTIEISGNAVPSGEQLLEIRRTGQGTLYVSAYLTNFTLEEEIEAAGLEVKIERRYYRLDPVRKSLDLPGGRGQAVEAERAAFNRVLIEDVQSLPSGTLVEVELLVESKNDYEYLIIEDRKAAGLEPIDVQSGYQYSGGLGAYREMREKHVAFFLRTLPRGQHSLRYQVRTEAPGQFTALPAVITGMYAPELVGNSSDKDLKVEEADEPRRDDE